MRALLRIGVALALASCSGKGSGPPTPHGPDVAQAAVDPNLAPAERLGDATVPRAYQLRLELDSAEGSFAGEVTIDIEIREPVHTIWLHAKELQLASATLEQAGAFIELEAVKSESDSELLGLQSNADLAPGPAQLHMRWKGPLGSIQGLFRQTDQGRWYIYSDFEATDARAAFPCYDDPRFKVPWSIALQVPADHQAFSNAPEASRTLLEGGDALVRFATTPPLPSYLVAVAAGPFEMIEGRASNTPLRIIAPKGQAEAGRFVLDATGSMLRYLEQYLGAPMPFAKLDFIAVPRFGGAMENPGLITFSSGILLVGDNPGAEQKRRALGVTAHELAHLWFGDLITPDYWNDLWLNEAFATWLSDKAVAHVQPERAAEVLDIADKSAAFAIDHGLGGRRVREPIDDREDIRAAFDRITYRKGGALLTMLEAWLGETRMRKAVQGYLRENHGGTVRAETFVASMRQSSGEPALEDFFKSFLTQTGIPLVQMSVQCDGAPAVTLRQSRYLPLETRPTQSALDRKRLWTLPVCMRYPSDTPGAAPTRHCIVLDRQSAQVPLHTKSCPAWLLPNDADSGYYHYLLSAESFAALPTEQLTPRESLGAVYSIVAALHSGQFDVAQALALLEPFRNSSSEKVHEVLFDALHTLANSVIKDAQRPAFAAMIRRWYQPMLQRIGLEPQVFESPWMASLRPPLTLLLADLGEDIALRASVLTRVNAWLENPTDIDFTLLDSWLQTAALGGDQALVDRYRAAARKSQQAVHRLLLTGALYAVRDPQLFAETLKDGPRPSTVWSILAGAMRHAELRSRIFELLPAEDMDSEELAALFSTLCDQDAVTSAQTFTKDPTDVLDLLLPIRGCMAFAEVQRSSAAKLFDE